MRGSVVATRLVALVLVAAVLAGCSGGSGEAAGPPPDEQAVQDLDLKATATTGIIRGVVVDEAIRPIVNVSITLAGPREGATRSNANGAFGFDALEPGTYFLGASKAGYSGVQQSVDVVAGVENPPIVKVQMLVDAETAPFVEEYVFDGFIECSFTLVVVGFAACGAVPILTEFLCEEAGACLGNLSSDKFAVTYVLARPPTWLQSEMVWQSTQALGNEMAVMYSWNCGNENGGFLCDHGAQGVSPVLVTANQTEIAEINEGNLGTSPEESLFVRVFNRGLPETDPGPGGGLGATLQQRFSIYSHFFYGYEPPEGWRLTEDGEVPRPQ